jgi:hypothetical protein
MVAKQEKVTALKEKKQPFSIVQSLLITREYDQLPFLRITRTTATVITPTVTMISKA